MLDCERGNSAVEFSLVGPIFLGVLLGAIQYGIAGIAATNFQNAVLSAARHIRTGQAAGTANAPAFKRLICSAMADATAHCFGRLHVDLRSIAGFADAGAVSADPTKDRFDAGAANQIMLLTASYEWPMVTPFLGDGFSQASSTSARFTAHVLFKNEPF
jgi:Flp pilus assembly protein TadG